MTVSDKAVEAAAQAMHCPLCMSHDVECQGEPHVHRCNSCGYDGTKDSGVGRARPDEAVEAERRQDQAEPCDSAPPNNQKIAEAILQNIITRSVLRFIYEAIQPAICASCPTRRALRTADEDEQFGCCATHALDTGRDDDE